VSKRSTNKTNMGGRKQALRLVENGVASKELLAAGHEVSVNPSTRELQVPLITHGVVDENFIGANAVQMARQTHATAISELPVQAHRLQRGDAALPTEFI
jgi:nicotinate phosphoribosyltransferase